jgi:hypothetical protein
MLTVQMAKTRLEGLKGAQFPLVFWQGSGTVVDVGESSLALQVRGKRADYTWDRLMNVLDRLETNHNVSVDELGGGHDAVGLVSLTALLEADDVDVAAETGMLRLRDARGVPVHQDAPALKPRSWTLWRRKLDGN